MEKPNDGLVEAIKQAGGITALARSIGIKPPSVAEWRRVPAARVIAVENATGVPRERLRPDLFSRETQATQAAE